MIEDIVNKEINSNPEILDLISEIEIMESEINDYDLKSYKNFKSNVRLIIASCVAFLITFILMLVCHGPIISPIACFLVARYSLNTLASDFKADEKNLMEMQDKYDELNDELEKISYSICEKVVHRFEVIANEAARYIKDGNLNEIIANYNKYSDVAFLLEKDYSMILMIMVSYGQAGIKSIDEIPARDKDIIYCLIGKLNNNVNPIIDFDLKVDFFEDEQTDEYENNNPKTLTKKRS